MRHALTAIDMWRNGVVLWSSMIETQVDMARAGFGMMDFWPGSPAEFMMGPMALAPKRKPVAKAKPVVKAKATPEVKAEAPKPEAEVKAEAPKPEVEVKAEAPKPGTDAKVEAPKPEAEVKADAPKAEAAKRPAGKGKITLAPDFEPR